MISLQLGAHCASWLIVCAFALSLAKILMACVGFITPNFLANKHAPNEPQTQHDIEGRQGKREGRRELSNSLNYGEYYADNRIEQ